MNLTKHPELLQKLAASYALGTLRGGARRRFETLARAQPEVRAAALLWQSHWAGLTELQAPQAPPPAVWTRIDNLVQAERAALRQRARQSDAFQTAPAALPWWQRLAPWRLAAGVGALSTCAAVVVALQVTGSLRASSGQQIAQLQGELAALSASASTPQDSYVAVLRDDKSAAALLVTLDARTQQLQLQRVGSFQTPADRSLQLWALPAGGKPRSLGVLQGGRTEALPAAADALQGVPMLAISLEPRGGVPSEGGPTGPVLFTGEWIARSV